MDVNKTNLPFAFPHGNTSSSGNIDTGSSCLCQSCNCVETDTCTRGSFEHFSWRNPCTHRTMPHRNVSLWHGPSKWNKKHWCRHPVRSHRADQSAPTTYRSCLVTSSKSVAPPCRQRWHNDVTAWCGQVLSTVERPPPRQNLNHWFLYKWRRKTHMRGFNKTNLQAQQVNSWLWHKQTNFRSTLTVTPSNVPLPKHQGAAHTNNNQTYFTF